jgi:hypothetical protein
LEELEHEATEAEELEHEATEAEDEYDSPEELLEDLMEEMEEAEEPESEIECSNPFHVLMSSGAESSEASGTDDYNTAEELDETAYDADAETDATVDVEEPAVALQSSLLPSPEQKPKRKRKRKRKNRASRKHGTDDKRQKGGARLRHNQPEARPSGPNPRTCLLDSVTALLPDETKEQVHATMLKRRCRRRATRR